MGRRGSLRRSGENHNCHEIQRELQTLHAASETVIAAGHSSCKTKAPTHRVGAFVWASNPIHSTFCRTPLFPKRQLMTVRQDQSSAWSASFSATAVAMTQTDLNIICPMDEGVGADQSLKSGDLISYASCASSGVPPVMRRSILRIDFCSAYVHSRFVTPAHESQTSPVGPRRAIMPSIRHARRNRVRAPDLSSGFDSTVTTRL